MITVTSALSGTYFSSTIPDISFAIGGDRALVTLTVGGKTAYSERLYPVGGQVRLVDVTDLVTPIVRQTLVARLELQISEESGEETVATALMEAKVVYCKADFGSVDAEEFFSTHFLSILLGSRRTAPGRLEYLHFIGGGEATVKAEYADGTVAQFTAPKIMGSEDYSTIDVSPNRFSTEGKQLIGYTVEAGRRVQQFDCDLSQPDCAPMLLFVNSFGVEEIAYCTGTHKVAPTYSRSSSYIEGKLKNYDIEETRKFTADTGVLTTAEANWFDDLFRSDMVRLLNIYGGEPVVGKEVTLTESKSENDNNDDTLPRFTFSYQYAQRNHNVVDLSRAGRIFDNTFDYTFN